MRKTKRQFIVLLLLFMSTLSSVYAQDQLLPRPQKLQINDGVLKANSFAPQSDDVNANELAQIADIEISNKGAKLVLRVVDKLPDVPLNNEEGYILRIAKGGVSIDALSSKGLYWGLQTLFQLTKEHTNGKLPYMTITDWPAFKIRGWMQDVGRSYISMDELKREIAILSKYKVNVFHWHLTENQAWRMESKIYPELTDAKNMTRMAGKYYTQEDARELIEFCKKHNMILIPEFEMPGHSAAFTRAFGVDMQSAEGIGIVKKLMTEMIGLFSDVPYIHIGTDEVHFTNSNFCNEMVAYVRKYGKKVISWNPGWRYKKGEIDMTQMWSLNGVPLEGVPAIDSKFHYLNHFDTFADIVGLYTSKIANVDSGSDQFAGTILALWHDRYIDDEYNMIIENHLYPNMLAIAERSWQGGGWQYFTDFGTNLVPKSEPFKAFVDFERRMLWHKDNFFDGYPFAYVKQTDVEWNITGQFPNEGDLAKSFEPETELKNSYAYDGEVINVSKAVGSGFYLRHPWGEDIVMGVYDKPKTDHTAYAWTWVYSPQKQDVGLWFETQNYSRSEADLAPKQGTWDYKKSAIWINDNEIAPPVWESNHTEREREIPLTNENMVGREPLKVTLNKGWNKVFIKLPVGKFTLPETRLVKWMFSAAFVTLDGKDRPEGLVYSSEPQ